MNRILINKLVSKGLLAFWGHFEIIFVLVSQIDFIGGSHTLHDNVLFC